MSRGEYVQLQGERTALERMIAETPPADVIDRASLEARLQSVQAALRDWPANDAHEPARVRLTFKGRPVIGSHGIVADFGMKAVNGFTESVTVMAASLTTQLAATGPIPNRDQHQLLITKTALGSFGFELEEYRSGQLELGESAIATALERTQALVRGSQGTDEELADAVAEADRRALDKVRGFLQVLADHEAVCTIQVGESIVSFQDVGLVRRSIARLSQENLRESVEMLEGKVQGVLPKGRLIEFKVASSSQVLRISIGPAVAEPESLNDLLNQPTSLEVLVTRVGNGRPRYMLMRAPASLAYP